MLDELQELEKLKDFNKQLYIEIDCQNYLDLLFEGIKKIKIYYRNFENEQILYKNILNINLKSSYFKIYKEEYLPLYLCYNEIPKEHEDFKDILEICGYFCNSNIIISIIKIMLKNKIKNSKDFLKSFTYLLITNHLKKHKKIYYINPYLLINEEDIDFKIIFYKYVNKIYNKDLNYDENDIMFLNKKINSLLYELELNEGNKITLTEKIIVIQNFNNYIKNNKYY